MLKCCCWNTTVIFCRGVSLIEVDIHTTYTLSDFVALQEKKGAEVREKLAALREEVVSVMFSACQVSELLCCCATQVQTLGPNIITSTFTECQTCMKCMFHSKIYA